MKKILYIQFLLFSILSFGQEVVVSGKITDKKTGEPISGATIAINKTLNGTKTDFDGNYFLKVPLKDTLVFSFLGMKTKKIKVINQEINVQLEDDGLLIEGGIPYMPPKKREIELTRFVTKKDIENADNPKYNFKKYAKNNVFVIFVSELTSYNLNKEDLEFQQKYNIKYSLIGGHKIDYLTKYNKLTFKYLKKKYKKTWLTEIRKDAIGLENFKYKKKQHTTAVSSNG